MSCKKAQGFLEKASLSVDSITDAAKERRGRAEALALAKTVSKIFVAKGKKVIALDWKKDAPDDETLAGYLLGPTGNLRAPTLRQGQTLYVGFSADAYQQLIS